LKILLFYFVSAFSFVSSAQILTVNGAIDPEEMGLTLVHEHIMVDWIGADSTGYDRWDKNEIFERALPYLEELKVHGVTTFLDCTPAYVGRDPYILQRLSERTGINILTNTGYYGAGANKFIPQNVMDYSPQDMAAQWIKEYEHGIDGSGIRPGFIKISVDNQDELSVTHENLIKTAALTHLKTGLTIVSHTGSDGPAMAQLKVLKRLGVSAEAFVWTHAQNGTMAGYMKAANQGAWISLDNLKGQVVNAKDGTGNIAWFVKTLNELKSKGILNHILISHDSGWYNVGQENGGNYRGYTDLFTQLIPSLKENGFTQEDIDLLLRSNPKRAYNIQIRKSH